MYLSLAPLIAAVETTGMGPLALFGGQPGLYRQYLHAVKAGRVKAYIADEICIMGMGVHPAYVYRDEWWGWAEQAAQRGNSSAQLQFANSVNKLPVGEVNNGVGTVDQKKHGQLMDTRQVDPYRRGLPAGQWAVA